MADRGNGVANYAGSYTAQQSIKFRGRAFVLLEEVAPISQRILRLLVSWFTHCGEGRA